MNNILLFYFMAFQLVSQASAETLEYSLARAVETMSASSPVADPKSAAFTRELVNNIESGRVDESALKAPDLATKRFVEVVSCYLNGVNLPKPPSQTGKPSRLDEGFLPLPLTEGQLARHPKWKAITYEQIIYWINSASSNITQWCKEEYGYWYIGHCDNCISLLIQSPSMQSSLGLDEIKTIASLSKLCRDTTAGDAPNQLSLTTLTNRLNQLLQNLKTTNNGFIRLISEFNIANLTNQISTISPSLGIGLRSNKFISDIEKRVSSLNVGMVELARSDSHGVLSLNMTSTTTEQRQAILLDSLSKLEARLQTQDSEDARILIQQIIGPAIAQMKSSCCGGTQSKPK